MSGGLGRVWPWGKIMGPKRWHTWSQSPGRVPRISSPRSSATWSRLPPTISGFRPSGAGRGQGGTVTVTPDSSTIRDPNNRSSDHTHLTSFTNYWHNSIRAHSSHKHIVWSPLWKRTQLVCQATYPNSCFKFPQSPSSAPCVSVFASYLPAPDPRNQLLETPSVIPRSL